MEKDRFIKIAEGLEWGVYECETRNGKTCFEISTYSDIGQDFVKTIWVRAGDFAGELFELWQSFDPDYEASLWIGPDGHGANGAPYHITDIVNDMIQCEEMLKELYEAVRDEVHAK